MISRPFGFKVVWLNTKRLLRDDTQSQALVVGFQFFCICLLGGRRTRRPQLNPDRAVLVVDDFVVCRHREQR